ncbi:AraC family transcriptional activator FtrA [Actinokineospora auranticolor]|uniref:AraC family transcriptional activator FtrA n=2 Tax=Actinokineospora auranticolor TaxID=155976 RepID=A0A2S6GUR8_9PSEU|nr:AraC family transcriptional activator FtrA [Actinokineospora auranticolor]
MSAFELGIVTEVFGLPRPELDVEWYRLTIHAHGPVRVVGGATLTADAPLDAIAAAHTVIVPGVSDVRAPVDPAVVAALRAAHANGARLVSICSGAFAIAATGLLDGRRAATHWRYAARLAARHPEVEVDAGVLYVDDGDVLTSAGSAAGIDLCLHLVRRDHGATTANAVARRLVVPPHRDGGQAQFIETPMPAPEDDAVTASMAWALANLAAPITVDLLARRAHLSTRTYLRRFKQGSGTSPIRWLIEQRVQASLPLLESGDRSIDEVAAAVGFESAVTFRHHFTRALRTSPSAYRRAFKDR